MRDVRRLREQAARCRRLAECASDDRTVAILTQLALEYEAEARGIAAGRAADEPAAPPPLTA